MTTLASYSDLVTECQDWLFGRSDIAAKIPSFIRIFEAHANRVLDCHYLDQRSTADIDLSSDEPQFLSLPSDFHSMRSVRLNDVTGKPRLKYATAAQMADFREARNNQVGQPIWFSVIGDEIEFCPTPAIAHEIEMVYRKYIPKLGNGIDAGTQTTNWLLDLAPDAYLFGTLAQAAPYLADDDRTAQWVAQSDRALQEINDLSEKAQYSAGPLTIRRKGRYY